MSEVFTAEQSVIGGLMLISSYESEVVSKVTMLIKPASFSNHEHQKVYKAICNLITKQINPDIITVESELSRMGFGGGDTLAYLAEVAKNTPSAANIMNYVSIVRSAAIKRMANTKLQDAIALLNDESEGDIYKRLGLLESMIGDIQNNAMKGSRGGLKHIGEVAEQWMIDWEERYSNPDKDYGVSTGVAGLDSVLGFKKLQKGSLVVIGARPKMGKTALLNMMCLSSAIDRGETTAMFSLEMPSKQIFERMISERANVPASAFYPTRSNLTQVDDSQDAKILAHIKPFVDSSFYIDDTAPVTIKHIQKEVRILNKSKGMGMIFIDYLTLMDAGKADRNDLAYGEITKALKALAKELDCIVVLLTQLNRSLESRQDKRPMPSDSRDTGQIEQDCDVWIGLYREAVYTEVVEGDEGLTECIVRYNRHGTGGTCYLELREGYFVEADRAARKKMEGKKRNDNF